MRKTQFSERRYEQVANNELSRDGPAPLLPSQNAEFYLCFDAAHNINQAHSIWSALSVQAPIGLTLPLAFWPDLPQGLQEEILGEYVSLFMQYKRPVFQNTKSAKHFKRIGKAYYEVAIEPHQQRGLAKLERKVKERAVVRYAAAAFLSNTDLLQHHKDRQILTHSVFTSPKRVKRHQRWMYCDHAGTHYFNPEFSRTDGDTWKNVVTTLLSRTRRESLRDHVHALAVSLAGEIPPSLERGETQWIERIRNYVRLDDQDVRFLVDISRVAAAADEVNASWAILLKPDPQFDFLKNQRSRRWPW